MLLKYLGWSLAALAVCFPLSAAAQETQSAAGIVIDDRCTSVAGTQDEDQAAVDRAIASLNRSGYAGLQLHLEALRTVAERAPACFPEVFRQGRNIVVRSADPSAGMTLALLLSELTQNGEASVSVSPAPNTYPLALLLLAAYEVEQRRYEQALPLLDRGLALQPNNQYLSFEKVAALQGLHRFQEAADLLKGMIDNPALVLSLDRVRAFRNLGVVLIDLNRLDEAEAALNESLRLEPNNPSARHELEYIAELRRGGAQRPLEVTSPASEPRQGK